MRSVTLEIALEESLKPYCVLRSCFPMSALPTLTPRLNLESYYKQDHLKIYDLRHVFNLISSIFLQS